jgi:hypothetical protein
MKVVGDDGAIAGGLAVCVEDSVPSRERFELGRKKREVEITTCGEPVPEMSENTRVEYLSSHGVYVPVGYLLFLLTERCLDFTTRHLSIHSCNIAKGPIRLR